MIPAMKTCPLVVTVASMSMLLVAGCTQPGRTEKAPQEPAAREAQAAPAKAVPGQALYDAHCASCHRMGSYDAKGRGPDLAGRRSLRAQFVSRHAKVKLTDQEVADLRDFLAAGR
jgi:mono/diheme cytochrome c family protein